MDKELVLLERQGQVTPKSVFEFPFNPISTISRFVNSNWLPPVKLH